MITISTGMKTSTKKRLAPLIIALLPLGMMVLSGCHSRQGEVKTAESQPEGMEMLQLTPDQIAANGLVLGEPFLHTFSGVVEASGQLEALPRNRAAVNAVTGGVIRDLTLLPGDRVSRGQTLFRIENQELLQLQEDYLTALASLAFLKDDYERQKLLADENISARKQFLKAESDYLSTQARITALEARLNLLRIDREVLRQGRLTAAVPVISPISGFVASVSEENGVFVSPENPVLEIVETSPLMVTLQVFEKDIPQINTGQPVRFRVPEVSADTMEASVVTSGKALSDLRTVTVHALFTPGKNSSYLPGMFVKAEIITGSHQALALPLEALISGEEGEFVLVRSDPRNDLWILKKVKVISGMKQGNLVEILSPGITPGDQVVVNGAFSVAQ